MGPEEGVHRRQHLWARPHLLFSRGRCSCRCGDSVAGSVCRACRGDSPRSDGTSTPTVNTVGTSSDRSEQLANLTSLHTQGALSDDEFAQAKAKLLDAD